jgi:hypothetical protein
MELGQFAPILKRLDRSLRNPLQLRIILAGSLLGAWYGLVYSPLSNRIVETAKNRGQVEAHLSLARDIETLRDTADSFKDRLPSHQTTNEWVEYLLAGVRKFPVKLLRLEPQGMRKHGPFDVALLQIELHGEFKDLDAVLAWIESNPRLLRVDSLNFLKAGGQAKGLDLKLVVAGLAD